MKKLILSALAIVAVTLTTFAQSPDAFKYQAVIRDGSQNIIPNQAVGVQLTIRQGSATGTAVYQETFSPTTSSYGLVNLEIGTGTVVSGTFATINWANGPYFIETGLDPTGGTTYASMGTSQLVSVPYALHATTASSSLTDNVFDGDSSATNELQTLSISNDTISISSGNSIVLPSNTGDNDWQVTGNNMTAMPIGNVAIGVTVLPNHKLAVGDTGLFKVGIGHAGNFNEVESGRLVFTEDINFNGTCGFEFWHDGAANTLSLVSGCTTLGDTSIVFTRTGEVRIPERVKIGENSNPSCDVHIKQSSNGTAPASAGLRLEANTNTNQNQIWTDGTNLNFSYNGTRISYITNVGAYTQVSDRRLKSNITPMNSVLDNVMKLKPVEYNYNHTPLAAKSKGFIAQDVQAIFPELVNKSEDGMLAVQYVEFGVIAVKAIQEQQEQINQQQAEIDALKAAIEELKGIIKKDVNSTNTDVKVEDAVKANSYKNDADQ